MAEDREAIERLERRVAELETIVRELVARTMMAPPPRPRAVPPAFTRPRAVIPAPLTPTPQETRPTPRTDRPAPTAPAAAAPPGEDWEQWVGQRGLLIVGVLALLATGGFFLNYAIQHGWIPPAVRATGAVVAGLALVYWGDRLVRRGLVRYGAAIIGGGGGLVYLGVWAAAGPYALLSRDLGVLLLAACSSGVALLAVRHETEALAAWALAGAYLAPVFLAGEEPVPAKFFAYQAVIGTSAMLLADRLGWRRTFNVALFGFFLLPMALLSADLSSVMGINYAVLGGVVALLATGRRSWPEARLGALGLAWLLLYVGASRVDDAPRWAALGGGAALVLVVWWQQLRATPLARAPDGQLAFPVELIAYLVGPLMLAGLAAYGPPESLVRLGGVVPLAVAVLYLTSGWPRRSLHMVVMGYVLLALAVSVQWDGTVVAVGWAVLAVAAGASDRWGGRPGAREVAAGVALAAFLQLFVVAQGARPATDPAFVGGWASAWYVCLVAFILVAHWWRPRSEASRDEVVGVALWGLAGATLLLGGSLELVRQLRADDLAAATALQLYWLACAVLLVRGAWDWHPARLRHLALGTALVLVGLSLLTLFLVAREMREAADPAFFGVWSIGWYACCLAAVVGARSWPADAEVAPTLRPGRVALWGAGGVGLLLGGSLELHRAFTSELAGDLAISTFWLVYAGALVRVGFWLDQKLVRSAGLAVAALAALKIVLYDLSNLEALYRVGSFFVLALITLAVAYAYNRRAKTVARTGGGG